MNIFYLHPDPQICASYHCDKHVPKMILEYTQLLFGGYFRVIEENPNLKHILEGIPKIYKKSHWNHPCSIWARKNYANWVWLMFLAYYLCSEFRKRYGKKHACEDIIIWMALNPCIYLPESEDTSSRPICMPQEIIEKHKPLKSYRNYYCIYKSKFATWKKLENTPKWYSIKIG